MQSLDEMLLGVSALLSVTMLALLVVLWRKLEAGNAAVPGLAEELERICGWIDFPPPASPTRAAAMPNTEEKEASARQSALAGRIAEFSRSLGGWCDAAGDKPATGVLRERKSGLDALAGQATSDSAPASTAWMQFAKQSAEIARAVLSATDKDFVEDPHRGELEEHLVVMVEAAELALIDPRPGTPLDRTRHEPRGGSAGGPGHARETVTAVLSRGLERPSAPKDSRARVLMKAEVRVNY